MRVVYGGSEAGNTRIDGQDLQEGGHRQKKAVTPDKVVRPVTHINGERIRFKDLAKFAWPEKTEANLAFYLRVDPRTARRWLADDNEPPAEALGVILSEIMKRFHQR